MKCLNCQHLDLREFPSHAKAGMGRCKLEKMPGVFESITKERECKTFIRANEDAIGKRMDWAAKL